MCSDLWSDYEASEMCKAEGFVGGRHTTTSTEQEFVETEVSCYLWDNYGGDVMAAYQVHHTYRHETVIHLYTI